MFRFLWAGALSIFVGCLAIASCKAEPVLTPKDLVEVRYIGGGTMLPKLSLTPRGDAVAFAVVSGSIDNNDYEVGWFVFELESEAGLIHVGDGGDLILNIRQRFPPMGALYGIGAKWSPDGQWLAYPKKTNGEIQIWRSSRDGKEQAQVSFGDADVFGSAMYEANFVWSTDGSKIYYEVGRSRAFMSEAMIDEGQRGFLYNDRFISGHSTRPGWIRCGRTRTDQRPFGNQACEPKLLLVDIASGQARDASKEERAEYSELSKQVDPFFTDQILTEKDRTLAENGDQAWFQNIDPDLYQGFQPMLSLYKKSAKGEARECRHYECTGQFLSKIWFHRREVVFTRKSTKDTRKLAIHKWNPETDHLSTLIETNDHIDQCQKSADRLICFYESASHARRLVSVDLNTGDIEALYDPNANTHEVMSLKVEHLHWSNDKDETAAGVLVYPKNYEEGQTYPLVISSSLPSGFLLRASEGELPVHLLAKEGFFVLAASSFYNFDTAARLRGSALVDAEFSAFDRRLRALNSYQEAISLLTERGLIDPARVAVTGLSSGAASAKYALIHSDLFALVSLSTGYSGAQSYWFSPSNVRSQIRRVLNDKLPYEPEYHEYMSAENLGYHARTKVFPPILMQVADTELSHALFDHVLLVDEQQPSELYVFPDELHIKYQPVHRESIYRRNVQWMKFWLQGEVMEEPMDPDQYQRWTTLCQNYVTKLRESDRNEDQVKANTQACVLALEGVHKLD